VYIADAPYERLELIGGEHDWAFVLGELGRVEQAATIASIVRGAGVLVLGAAVVIACWAALRPRGHTSDVVGLPIRAID
jgi:hypothetical protein